MRASLPIALLLALLAGCRTPPAPPPAAAAPPTTEFLVREARLADGEMTVRLEMPLSPAGRKPAVIAMLGDTRPLLAAGFVVATYRVHWRKVRGPDPTPLPAGQGAGKWVLASADPARLGERYLGGIAATAERYVPAALDWMVQTPEIDPERIGMVGVSTDGFVTLQAVGADSRLRAAVAIAACADYQTFLRFSSMGLNGAPLALAPSYAAWLREQEVIAHPQRAVHAALLMINRSADALIPVACADETARVLADAYAAAGVPQRFRYVRLEREGHGMSREEPSAALEWLRQWLQPQ